MFGKRVSEYIRFQKVILGLMAIVGLLRLGLSLAGLPDTTVRFFSITVVALAGLLYYGVAVHVKGFGSFKQLLPLVFFQTALASVIAVLGIVLSIAGLPNIFAAPEYSGPAAANQWLHAAAHLTFGIVVPTLIGWALTSLVLLVTRAITPRAVHQPAASA